MRWRGYTASDDAWEPLSQFTGSTFKVEQYRARHGLEPLPPRGSEPRPRTGKQQARRIYFENKHKLIFQIGDRGTHGQPVLQRCQTPAYTARRGPHHMDIIKKGRMHVKTKSNKVHENNFHENTQMAPRKCADAQRSSQSYNDEFQNCRKKNFARVPLSKSDAV